MTTCLGRIGCGALLVVFGAVSWHYRDAWLPRLRSVVQAEMPWQHDDWTVVTAEGAGRAAARIDRLRGRTGPSYVNIDGADFVAYALRDALAGIHQVDSVPEALIDDGQVYLRMRVRLADLGGSEALGAMAGKFSEPELVTIAGRLESVRPGLVQYRPTDVAVRDLKIPPGALARLLGRWGPSARPEGVGADALPIVLPEFVADLRVGGGRVTLYKQGP
ncbi:MAG: hypothetical protein WD771_11775 [Gemmatimonadaceae bacterium]